MLVKVSCKKCGESAKLDVGDMSKGDVEALLTKQKTFNCFGNHVELCSPINYWTIDWNETESGHALSEEEFVKQLQNSHGKVYSKCELQEEYEVIGFKYSLCVTKHKQSGETVEFDFIHSPKGARYYFQF